MNKRIWLMAALLLVAVGLRAWVSVPPGERPRKNFSGFPAQLGNWTHVGTFKLEDDVSGVLKADDILNRRYGDANGHAADLFIAYYKVQKAGESMHSPKNCLPGSGWEPVVNDTVALFPSGPSGKPVMINRYVIEKGTERSLVLYWYQANGRVIASEYWGKIFLVYDSFKSGRRDGALVRIVLPLRSSDNPDKVLERGLDFARNVEGPLPQFLPN